MKLMLSVTFLLFACLLEQNIIAENLSQELLSRNKRWLVWKEGINWIALIFGIGIPIDTPQENLLLGMTMKAYYRLPDNSSYYTKPKIDYYTKRRNKRSTFSRWMIYQLIENFMERNQYSDGKACLLKSICQIASIKLEERSGLLAEIVQHILTPSSTKDEILDNSNYDYHAAEHLGKKYKNCALLYSHCVLDPIEKFSKFISIGKYMD